MTRPYDPEGLGLRPGLVRLGDLLGPLTYLGRCPRCRGQHLSTHAMVLPDRTCAACAAKETR